MSLSQTPTAAPKSTTTPKPLDPEAIKREYDATYLAIRKLLRPADDLAFHNAKSKTASLSAERKAKGNLDLATIQALLDSLLDTNYLLRNALMTNPVMKGTDEEALTWAFKRLETIAAEININRYSIRQMLVDTLINHDPLKAAQTSVEQALKIEGNNVASSVINTYTDADGLINVALTINNRAYTMVLHNNKVGAQVVKAIYFTNAIDNKVPAHLKGAVGHTLSSMGETLARAMAFDGLEEVKKPNRIQSAWNSLGTLLKNAFHREPKTAPAAIPPVTIAVRPTRPAYGWFSPKHGLAMALFSVFLSGKPTDHTITPPDTGRPAASTPAPASTRSVEAPRPTAAPTKVEQAPQARAVVQTIAVRSSPEASLINFFEKTGTINGIHLDAEATAWRLNRQLINARNDSDPHAHTQKGDHIEIEQTGSHIGARIIRANGTVVCDTGPLSMRAIVVAK